MQYANDRTESDSAATLPLGVAIPSSFVFASFVMLGCGPSFSALDVKQDADGTGDVGTNDAMFDAIDERLDGGVPESDAESAWDGALDTSSDSALDSALDTSSDTQDPLPCENGDRKCEGQTYKWCEKGVWETQVCNSSTHKCDEELGGCYLNTCNPACSGGTFCRDDKRCSPKIFETQWEVTDDNRTITLPYYGGGAEGEGDKGPEGGAKCDFHVLWGDESNTTDFSKAERVLECNKPGVQHTYQKAGQYRVKILGTYIGWGKEKKDPASLKQLTKVISFGPVGLTQYAFCGIGHVTFACKDIPDATKLTNANGMFEAATGANYAIADWDVTNTLNMMDMFKDATFFYPQVQYWVLNEKVKLDNIFTGSAMDNKGVCALTDNEDSVWKKNEGVLGVSCSSFPVL